MLPYNLYYHAMILATARQTKEQLPLLTTPLDLCKLAHNLFLLNVEQLSSWQGYRIYIMVDKKGNLGWYLHGNSEYSCSSCARSQFNLHFHALSSLSCRALQLEVVLVKPTYSQLNIAWSISERD